MKIVINAVRVSRQGGGGLDHYVIHLVNYLAKLGAEFDLYTFAPEHFKDVPSERIIKSFSVSLGCHSGGSPKGADPESMVLSSNPLRRTFAILLGDWIKMFWTQFIFPFHLIFKRYDVLFSPSQIDALPFPPKRVRQVTAVLDLIPFILKDQKHKHMFFLKRIFPFVLKNSAHIITISDCTKRDVITFFKVPESKITSILLAKPEFTVGTLIPIERDMEQIRKKYGLQKYIFCVSSNHPHKNVLGLLKAYAIIQKKTDCSLAVAGYQDPAYQTALKEYVQKNGLENRVRFLGHVHSQEFPLLYKGAECFVFPSLYEGFGLPPLEALSYGVPVAVSNRSSLPEVVGDAGLYFDPLNPQEIADKIMLILLDDRLKKELSERGMERAKQFSWEKTAKETLAVLERVLS